MYLDLPDARVVVTDALLEMQDNIADTIEARAMSCIYGDAGLGKTFGVEQALKQLEPDLLLSLKFTRSRPGPKDLRWALFDEMGLPSKKPGTPTEFDELLRKSLPRRRYVILCDEAQQYRRECFEFVRNLWDACKRDRPAVLFVGGKEAYDTLCSDPALASRIYIRQEVLPMHESEVLTVIPKFHPAWEGVDERLILKADTNKCGGAFRMWAKVTFLCLRGMTVLRKDCIDEEVLDWALRRC
ncbi:AAA family ATPase [Kitasatospora sp. NPDC048407]|uniref:AAA family ATPase n=1 Tax=Kitasatospora sp. NPDC048407 TaxID=3364051 RepID=UPI0037100567